MMVPFYCVFWVGLVETTEQLNVLYVQLRTKLISLFLQSCWRSCKQICTDRHDVAWKASGTRVYRRVKRSCRRHRLMRPSFKNSRQKYQTQWKTSQDGQMDKITPKFIQTDTCSHICSTRIYIYIYIYVYYKYVQPSNTVPRDVLLQEWLFWTQLVCRPRSQPPRRTLPRLKLQRRLHTSRPVNWVGLSESTDLHSKFNWTQMFWVFGQPAKPTFGLFWFVSWQVSPVWDHLLGWNLARERKGKSCHLRCRSCHSCCLQA